MQHHLV